MPNESEWIIQPCTTDPTSGSLRADPTSASLREEIRRGMLVMPDESEWIIQRCTTDPTSGSLRADATSASLREADVTSGCPRASIVSISEDRLANNTQIQKTCIPDKVMPLLAVLRP
jgi:hypothetical protein